MKADLRRLKAMKPKTKADEEILNRTIANLEKEIERDRVTPKATCAYRGQDARMARDMDRGDNARVAYLRMRGRQRAVAQRIAGLGERATRRIDLERQWHEKFDVPDPNDDGRIPADPGRGVHEEEVIRAVGGKLSSEYVHVGKDEKDDPIVRPFTRLEREAFKNEDEDPSQKF